MTLANIRHVYGPVPSRRLGRSLGLDLVPYKTCTYDCIYCQLGRTTHLTLAQDTYVPADAILKECFQVLEKRDKPDALPGKSGWRSCSWRASPAHARRWPRLPPGWIGSSR